MNSATFLSATRASGGGLISDSASRSSLVAFSCASCCGAALGELVLDEHGGRDLARARRRPPAPAAPLREPDRIEDEHVALELADRDPALRHRRDQVVVADALEQRELPDQRIVRLQAGW